MNPDRPPNPFDAFKPKPKMPALPFEKTFEQTDEEFNNFMHRVTEVHKVVKNLASDDPNLQRFGMMEADRMLRTSDERLLENLDEDDKGNVTYRLAQNRTVINKKAVEDDPMGGAAEMSQQGFMEHVSKDAEARYKDRMVRTERMQTFKTQATKAFRRGDIEMALNGYNKAIEQIKDSPLLYNNRAICYIKMQLFDRAINDLNMALRLNTTGFRSMLLLAKCYYLLGKVSKFQGMIENAQNTHPDKYEFVQEFARALETDGMDSLQYTGFAGPGYD